MLKSLEDVVEDFLIHTRMGWETYGMLEKMQQLLFARQQAIDLGEVFLDDLWSAARGSHWIPSHYSTKDWISDACSFLRTGKEINARIV